MIGKIRKNWASTMAVGENNSPRNPSGPSRDRNKYNTKPTTTGGSPISAFKTTITPLRPGNRYTAKTAPKNNPDTAAIATAEMLTYIVRPMMV